jgi:hypothetical protein
LAPVFGCFCVPDTEESVLCSVVPYAADFHFLFIGFQIFENKPAIMSSTDSPPVADAHGVAVAAAATNLEVDALVDDGEDEFSENYEFMTEGNDGKYSLSEQMVHFVADTLRVCIGLRARQSLRSTLVQAFQSFPR